MFQAVERIVDRIDWTEPLADTLQSTIRRVTTSSAPASTEVRIVLSGTWLGHPFHPAITDVAVGAWTTTSVLDLVSALSSKDGIETAADIANATGLAAAIGSGLTGWNDWAETHGKDRKVGLIHGLVMGGTTTLYVVSMIARISGKRGTGAMTAAIGLGVLLAGTYLGGDEVFDLGYGVNHTAFEQGPTDFTSVVESSRLKDGEPLKVEAKGVPIMLVKQADGIHAMADTCVHAGCSLSEGSVSDGIVICPCHGSRYRLDDGSVLEGPATRPEPVYEVRVKDGWVEVKAATS